MGVDKGYGSGKPRGAGNSKARARVASKRFSKGKKNPEFNLVSTIKSQRAKRAASPIGQLADTLLGFALPTGKVATAAGMLLGKGKIGTATTMAQRLASKDYGRGAAKEIARNRSIPNMGQQAAQDSYERVSDLVKSGRILRGSSESVFPRAPKAAKSGTQAFNERKSVLASKRQSEKWLKNSGGR